MKDRHQHQPHPIRMPQDLKRWLLAQASDNHRSLNGEVVMRLEDSRRQQLARQQERAA